MPTGLPGARFMRHAAIRALSNLDLAAIAELKKPGLARAFVCVTAIHALRSLSLRS